MFAEDSSPGIIPGGSVLLHHPGPKEVLTGPVKAISNRGDGLRDSTVLWALCAIALQPSVMRDPENTGSLAFESGLCAAAGLSAG